MRRTIRTSRFFIIKEPFPDHGDLGSWLLALLRMRLKLLVTLIHPDKLDRSVELFLLGRRVSGHTWQAVRYWVVLLRIARQ